MSKRLVITDDALIIREIIKDAARAEGWEIAGEASNGQEAIDCYAEMLPDVMTLDLVMPQFDGLHALRGIKQINPDARVLVISALDQKEILKEALDLGASDFIAKPFQKERLVGALSKLATA